MSSETFSSFANNATHWQLPSWATVATAPNNSLLLQHAQELRCGKKGDSTLLPTLLLDPLDVSDTMPSLSRDALGLSTKHESVAWSWEGKLVQLIFLVIAIWTITDVAFATNNVDNSTENNYTVGTWSDADPSLQYCSVAPAVDIFSF